MKRKLLVGLSVMCLVTSMLPNVVFADSETGTVTEMESISETDKDAESTESTTAEKGTEADVEKTTDAAETEAVKDAVSVQTAGEVEAAATGLQITASAGTAEADSNGVWTLGSGTYDVTGTALDGEYIVAEGNVTLNLNNATIVRPEVKGSSATLPGFAPAISVKSGTVTLNLTGSNKVRGSIGCAGIYVAEGATLNVQGNGELTANGGKGSETISNANYLGANSVYMGGGAGIGGNGMWIGNSGRLEGKGADFGTVNILSSKITAIGGKTISGYAGGGAGIGSGGVDRKYNDDLPAKGTVHISDGDINATGGEGQDSSETGGGAGIGAGGTLGRWFANSSIAVTISGGTVYAEGGSDAAGIGGGANVDGGKITISAGNVTAVGGHESSGSYGGAGIGGGDNGGVISIEISGGKVTATAGGAAAGIGAGNDFPVGIADPDTGEVTYGDITISGTADVTAYGGATVSGSGKVCGGAAIGSANKNSSATETGYHSISIKDQAKVRAYAGALSQAIGVGRNYDVSEPSENITTIESTTDVWMFNRDTTWGPFWGCDKADNYIGINLAKDATFPATDTLTDTNKEGIQWSYSKDGKVTIVKDGKTLAEETLPDGFTLGNWATITKQSANVTFVDGEKTTVETADDNGTVVAPKPDAKDGYVFDGWKSESGESYAVGDVITPSEDMTLTASWKKADVWVDDKADDKTLTLDLETVIDTQIEAECGVEISDEGQAALLADAKALIKEIMNGKTPAGLTDAEAAQIREALNAGQPKVSVKMVINVVLNGDLTEDEAAIKAQMKDGEEAQLWNLSIKMSVAVIDGNAQQVGTVDNVYLTETDDKITFDLTTGDDYTNKSVRVLYLHDDQVKEAEFAVTDKANGKISIKANEFSPYAVLTKADNNSGSIDKPATKPTDPKADNGQNANKDKGSDKGSAKTKGAVKKGDTNHFGVWLALFCCAIAGVSALSILRFRKKR